MREGLKRRIEGKGPYTLTKIAVNFTTKNVFSRRIANANCVPTGNCEIVRDASGFYVNNNQINQQTQRAYYAPFRQPLKGYRKSVICPPNVDTTRINKCLTYTEIYQDPYTDCSGSACLSNGSLPTTNVPTTTWGQARATSGINTRTARPLIRSGMQPNTAGQQNSGKPVVLANNPKRYSYSYRELINNRRKDTVIKKLATEKPTNNLYVSGQADNKMYGYGGNCPEVNYCNPNISVYKLNNTVFKVQGAVESSSRIDRLRLETIRGESRCPPGTTNQRTGNNCNGVYFAGRRRHIMGPPGASYTQRKYKNLFNTNHTEVNYPQTSALARVRGVVSKKTTTNPNGGVCCNNKPPQFLL